MLPPFFPVLLPPRRCPFFCIQGQQVHKGSPLQQPLPTQMCSLVGVMMTCMVRGVVPKFNAALSMMHQETVEMPQWALLRPECCGNLHTMPCAHIAAYVLSVGLLSQWARRNFPSESFTPPPPGWAARVAHPLMGSVGPRSTCECEESCIPQLSCTAIRATCQPSICPPLFRRGMFDLHSRPDSGHLSTYVLVAL